MDIGISWSQFWYVMVSHVLEHCKMIGNICVMHLAKELLRDKYIYFVVECDLLNLGDISLITAHLHQYTVRKMLSN